MEKIVIENKYNINRNSTKIKILKPFCVFTIVVILFPVFLILKKIGILTPKKSI